MPPFAIITASLALLVALGAPAQAARYTAEQTQADQVQAEQAAAAGDGRIASMLWGD